ncbi:MAG: DUF554 family protein [[Clostridium] innocuum]
MSNALVICVGAMAVVGALQDGLTHDASMLITRRFSMVSYPWFLLPLELA